MANQFKLEKISLLYLDMCYSCALIVSPAIDGNRYSLFVYPHSHLKMECLAWAFWSVGQAVNKIKLTDWEFQINLIPFHE